MFRFQSALAIGIAAIASSPAMAAVTPVSQERYIFQSVGQENLLQSADGFGLFSASFSAASQLSFINADVATGSGSAGPDPSFGINSVTSYFKYTFDVSEPTDFEFFGELATGMFGSAAAHLSGPGGDIVNITISPFQMATWNETGSLAPGMHTLEVFTSNSIGGELSTFDFALLVPSPAGLVVLCLGGLLAPARRRRG